MACPIKLSTRPLSVNCKADAHSFCCSLFLPILLFQHPLLLSFHRTTRESPVPSRRLRLAAAESLLLSLDPFAQPLLRLPGIRHPHRSS
jgi:hypothetical protein